MVTIIQISEQYLKVVVAKEGGGRLQIISSFAERIETKSDPQITASIQEILKKLKTRHGSVILSLARNLTTVRNLHLPSQSSEEVAQMVDLNIIRIVPYKREDIVFGYRTLGLDEAGYTRALVAIVKTDVVRRLVKIIERANLTIGRIVLGSYGVWHMARARIGAAAADDLFLALEVDTDSTDLIIFSKDHLYFSRSINIGSQALAEQGDPGVVKFIGEIRQFLMMFYNEEINRKPGKIILCGARSGHGLLSVIEAELGIQVELAEDHFEGGPGDVSLASLCGFSPSGNEQIDFVLLEMQIRQSLSQTTRELVLLGGLCIYILTMFCGLYWGRSYNQEKYLARLDRTIEETEKTLGDLPSKQRKSAYVREYLDERGVPVLIYSQLQKTIPPRVSLTSVSVDEKGRSVLRGQAVELSDVFKFIDNLSQAGCFKDVQTRSIKKKKAKDRDLTEFELSLIFNQG